MSVSHDTPAGVRSVARSSRTPPGFIGRLKGLLVAPRGEWAAIAGEGIATARLYTGFIGPLALLDALVAFIHVSILGTTEPLSGTVRASLPGGLITASMVVACGLVGIFLIALVIDWLAPLFGAERNLARASAVAAYSSTPVWLATVAVPFPTLWPTLQVLAVLYHTYLLYLGLRMLMKAARDRLLGYATTIVLCTILLHIVFTMLSAGLGGATHMNPYRAFG